MEKFKFHIITSVIIIIFCLLILLAEYYPKLAVSLILLPIMYIVIYLAIKSCKK